MFTGLIQGKGVVDAVESRGSERRFRVRALFDLDDIVQGESIAVNGVCLTVETFGSGWFTAYASGETLAHTNLGGLASGKTVNLERALALGERLGGHLVSGHVDDLAEVLDRRTEGRSTRFRLGFDAKWGLLVVPKGSVALDGISLTVNHCGSDFLEVNIIPATISETTIDGWKQGTRVNMETDLIGKYVSRMLAPWLDSRGKGGAVDNPRDLTIDFLRKHGF